MTDRPVQPTTEVKVTDEHREEAEKLTNEFLESNGAVEGIAQFIQWDDTILISETAKFIAQAIASAEARGVEMVAQMVEGRGSTYSHRLMWQGLAKEIRSLIKIDDQ